MPRYGDTHTPALNCWSWPELLLLAADADVEWGESLSIEFKRGFVYKLQRRFLYTKRQRWPRPAPARGGDISLPANAASTECVVALPPAAAAAAAGAEGAGVI